MRLLPALPVILSLTLAIPAAAQTGGSTGVGGGMTGSNAASGSGTMGSLSGSAASTSLMGRPAAPLGTQTTLSQNIDNAAGLNSNRAIINGTAGSLPPQANRTTGNTLPGRNALERAGRPAGAPLGSGTVSSTPTAGTPSPVPGDLPDNDPRRTAQ